MAIAKQKHVDFSMSFTKGSGFTNFMVCPGGTIGSDDPITIADILARCSIGHFGLKADFHGVEKRLSFSETDRHSDNFAFAFKHFFNHIV